MLGGNSTKRKKKNVIVLDTSAFVAGFDPFSVDEEQYTVPNVKEELAKTSLSLIRFHFAEKSGKLIVKNPEKTYLDEIKTSATKVGDSFLLSEVDFQVLALALQFKMNGQLPKIVTDDYSIQNVAYHIGIKFVPLATFGIRRPLKWIRYCPACRKEYPANYKFKRCEICDTQLKRKPRPFLKKTKK